MPPKSNSSIYLDEYNQKLECDLDCDHVRIFVSRYAIFLEKKFIQEGGSGRNVELREVQDLQTIPEISVDGPQNDPQSKVPTNEIYP